MLTSESSLSQKPIPSRERLIFALATPDIDRAKQLVKTLDEHVHFFKLGLELFMADGYHALLAWLTDRNKQAFVD